MHLVVLGDGKMGRAITELATSRGHLVELLGRGTAEPALQDAVDRGAVVAIEVSVPGAAAWNTRRALAAGLAVVVGTTGWYAERTAVEAFAADRGGALLIAPNFSLGVVLFTELAATAGRLFGPHSQYDVALHEVHHSAKRDAPSGTGMTAARAVEDAMGRPVPVSSTRVGFVPGTHTLIFDGPFEQIVLSHEARDRRVFADGALRAAEWLIGRRGLFSMRDVLGLDTNR